MTNEMAKWPLEKEGDRKFFGHPIALGVVPLDEDSVSTRFVAFLGDSKVTCYVLPNDDELWERLHSELKQNRYGLESKIWINKIATGYNCDQP